MLGIGTQIPGGSLHNRLYPHSSQLFTLDASETMAATPTQVDRPCPTGTGHGPVSYLILDDDQGLTAPRQAYAVEVTGAQEHDLWARPVED
jgi:hypothetical protein